VVPSDGIGLGFPHAIDDRQQALDAEFSVRADWQGRMTQLRQVFRDGTEYRVAREFMAWFIDNGKLPSDRKAAALGKIRRDSVASCRDAVVEKGGDIIGVTVRHSSRRSIISGAAIGAECWSSGVKCLIGASECLRKWDDWNVVA
jgi:hypothetical protein